MGCHIIHTVCAHMNLTAFQHSYMHTHSNVFVLLSLPSVSWWHFQREWHTHTHTHTHKIRSHLTVTFYFTLWCRLPPVEHKTTIKRIRKSLNSTSSIRIFLTFRVCYLDRNWAYLIRILLCCSNQTKMQRCTQSSHIVSATQILNIWQVRLLDIQ